MEKYFIKQDTSKIDEMPKFSSALKAVPSTEGDKDISSMIQTIENNESAAKRKPEPDDAAGEEHQRVTKRQRLAARVRSEVEYVRDGDDKNSRLDNHTSLQGSDAGQLRNELLALKSEIAQARQDTQAVQRQLRGLKVEQAQAQAQLDSLRFSGEGDKSPGNDLKEPGRDATLDTQLRYWQAEALRRAQELAAIEEEEFGLQEQMLQEQARAAELDEQIQELRRELEEEKQRAHQLNRSIQAVGDVLLPTAEGTAAAAEEAVRSMQPRRRELDGTQATVDREFGVLKRRLDAVYDKKRQEQLDHDALNSPRPSDSPRGLALFSTQQITLSQQQMALRRGLDLSGLGNAAGAPGDYQKLPASSLMQLYPPGGAAAMQMPPTTASVEQTADGSPRRSPSPGGGADNGAGMPPLERGQ